MGKLGSYQRQRRTELSTKIRKGWLQHVLVQVAGTQVCMALGEERSPREALRAGPPLGSGVWPRGPSHTAALVTGHRSEPPTQPGGRTQPPGGSSSGPRPRRSSPERPVLWLLSDEQCPWVPASSYGFWPLSRPDQGGGCNGLSGLCGRGILLNVSSMFITF